MVPATCSILPATPVPVPGIPLVESDVFRPDVLAILATVPDLIPFPPGRGTPAHPPGHGGGGPDRPPGRGVPHLVQAGAQISVIANAEEFGEDETVVYFFRENQREKAQRLLDSLGTGTLEKDTSLSDTVDVVVVLGQDYIDSIGGASTATTLPGAGHGASWSPTPAGHPGAPGGETAG